MGAETVVTLIGVAIGVGAVAIYLIIVAATLNKVSFTVGTVLIGVRAIAAQCEPLTSVVRDIVNDVAAIEQTMGSLVMAGELPTANKRKALGMRSAR